MRTASLALAFLLLLAACGRTESASDAADAAVAAPEAPAVTDARALLQAMHDRYAATWYETFTFRQATITHHADGTADTATWHEAMKSPGRLRIDIEDLAEGNGILFRGDSIYSMQAGTVQAARPLIHPLLVLGFDVYVQPVARTVQQLEQLGYDLSLLHESTWQGRPVWVVGAQPGDTAAVQFWVDRERLLTLRTVRRVGPNQESVQDVRFERYEPLGDAWVASLMYFYVDGRLVTEEIYTEMRRDVELPDSLFDPAAWTITTPYWE